MKNEKVYGRKVVRNLKNDMVKRLYISWGVCLLIGLILGILLGWGIASLL